MTNPIVGVVMGSSSDWDTMQHAVQILEQFGVPHEARVVSAHRMPDDMFAYAEAAAGCGLKAERNAPHPYHSRNATPPQVTSASSSGERVSKALPPKIPAQISTISLNAHSEAIIK